MRSDLRWSLSSCMKIPGHNQMDSRLQLLPRDYLSNPHDFGRSLSAHSILPTGGNKVSQIIAIRQHRLATRLNDKPAKDKISTGTLINLFEISKQTWSRILLGQTWARQTGLTALELANAPKPKTPIVVNRQTRRILHKTPVIVADAVGNTELG